MKTSFAKIIKDLQNAGWQNIEIARKAGCSDVYISQLANGKRKQPSYDLGVKLVLLHIAIKP